MQIPSKIKMTGDLSVNKALKCKKCGKDKIIITDDRIYDANGVVTNGNKKVICLDCSPDGSTG